MVSPRGLTSFRVAFRGAWGLYCLYAICFNSFAAHPLISEDTATQGAGKFELELGNALTDDGADRSYELGPQLSYGVLTTLDVIVRPTWLAQRTSSDSAASWQRGPGDTAIDVKWRFHERERWSFGTRFERANF